VEDIIDPSSVKINNKSLTFCHRSCIHIATVLCEVIDNMCSGKHGEHGEDVCRSAESAVKASCAKKKKCDCVVKYHYVNISEPNL